MKSLKGILIAGALLVGATANAGLIKATCTNSTGFGSQALCDTFFQGLEDDMNSQISSGDVDQSKYLSGMANAAILSQEGTNTDYANKFDVTAVGLGLGFAADIGDGSISDLSGDGISGLGGAGLGASVQVALNAGILPWDKIWGIELDKIDGFISFSKFDLASLSDDIEQGDITKLSVMGRYQLMEGYDLGGSLLKWGGLFVHSGFMYYSQKLVFNIDIPSETYNDGGNTATYSGTATFGAEMSAFTIPVEVSTYVDLLYFLTLYGGAGANVNVGGSESVANTTLNINVTSPGTAAGVATMDLGDEGDADKLQMKGFVGLQLNIWLLKVYTQVTTNFGGDTTQVAAGFGTKVVF